MTIVMRPPFVPIGKLGNQPVIVSPEWHRTIEQLVQAVNALQQENEQLKAQIAALGGP